MYAVYTLHIPSTGRISWSSVYNFFSSRPALSWTKPIEHIILSEVQDKKRCLRLLARLGTT